MDYTEIDLDRPRKLKFGIAELRDLQRRLGEQGVLQIAQRLRNLDLETVILGYWVGLRRDDPKLTPDGVEAILQGQLAAGRLLADFVGPLSDAIAWGAGLVRAEGNGQPQGKAPGTA